MGVGAGSHHTPSRSIFGQGGVSGSSEGCLYSSHPPPRPYHVLGHCSAHQHIPTNDARELSPAPTSLLRWRPRTALHLRPANLRMRSTSKECSNNGQKCCKRRRKPQGKAPTRGSTVANQIQRKQSTCGGHLCSVRVRAHAMMNWVCSWDAIRCHKAAPLSLSLFLSLAV
jgi:hypothetical protein